MGNGRNENALRVEDPLPTGKGGRGVSYSFKCDNLATDHFAALLQYKASGLTQNGPGKKGAYHGWRIYYRWTYLLHT